MPTKNRHRVNRILPLRALLAVFLLPIPCVPETARAEPSTRGSDAASATAGHSQLIALQGMTPVYAVQSMAYLADGAPHEAAVPAMPVSPYGVPVAPAIVGSPRTVGEIGVKYYDVNEGYANTYGGYGRFSYAPSSNTDVWLGEVVYLDRFDDEGTYVALGNIHHFNDVYYSTVFVGTSAGGFFWPSVRVDASLSRKWLPKRNLVSTIGIGYYDAKDDHTDTSLLFEGIYYFDAPWIVQAGVRLNESDPGSVFSPSGYAAATYGRDLDRFITLRYGTGSQGYQALTSPAFLVDFPFNEITLTWREWLQPDFGINLVGYGFESEPYDQIGFEMGIFKEF